MLQLSLNSHRSHLIAFHCQTHKSLSLRSSCISPSLENLKRPFPNYLSVSPSFFFSLSSSVTIYSSAKSSLPTLPFLVHWLHWPCLWALIVSFWGLKDARWALDVLKRQTVKPVCDWQITSLAFLWLAKTLNKLSMCSTARWIVHWLHCWIWIALKDAAQNVRSWVCVCMCVCVRSVRCCLYSQCSRPGVLPSDRIGADQRSLTE